MLRVLKVVLSATALAMLSGTLPASANPYAWVTVDGTVAYDDGGRPVALRQAWHFDHGFSAFAGKGVDRDGDGRYAPDERTAAAALNVAALAKFGYFTKVTAGGRPVALGRPTSATLGVDHGVLTLRFSLPLMYAPATAEEPLSVTVYDPADFIAFALAPGDAVRLEGAPADCIVTLTRRPRPPARWAAAASRPVSLAETATEAGADKATVACGGALLSFASPSGAAPFPPRAPAAALPPPLVRPPPPSPAERVEEALKRAAANPLTGTGRIAPTPPVPTPKPTVAGRSATATEPIPEVGIGGSGLAIAIALLGLAAALIGGLLVRGSAAR